MPSMQKHWLETDLEHFSEDRLIELDKEWHSYDEDTLWSAAYEVFGGKVPDDLHGLPMLRRNEIMMATMYV